MGGGIGGRFHEALSDGGKQFGVVGDEVVCISGGCLGVEQM